MPLLTYPGRKAASGQWQKIISNIPKCKTFVEVMCGSAYLSSLVMKTGCNIVLNDIDKKVIDAIDYTADSITKMNTDFAQVICKLERQLDIVFYCDPPYEFETRSYHKKIYRYEWNNGDHKRFLDFIQTVKAPVMISHYPSKLYDQKLSTWRKITYNTMTRAGIRKEILYLNFQQPILLQCYQHVGENFTERQRIKRKVDSYIKRLNELPGQERAAILSSIIDNYSYAISSK